MLLSKLSACVLMKLKWWHNISEIYWNAVGQHCLLNFLKEKKIVHDVRELESSKYVAWPAGMGLLFTQGNTDSTDSTGKQAWKCQLCK